MATITKLQRPTGVVYKARVRKSGHGEITKTFRFKSDAEKWARSQEAAVERDDTGLSTQAQRHTLNEAVARYRVERFPDLSRGTQEAYGPHLTFWCARLGHLKLSELRPEKIAAGRDAIRQQGRSPASCNRYLAALGAVLSRCVKHWHWLQINPVGQVAKLTENNARKRFLSEPELARLLDACQQSESPDLLLLVMLAVATGARRGELLGLRWRDVDLNARTLALLDTKNGDSRILPIPDAVLPLLAARQADPGALVFPSRVSSSQSIDVRVGFAKALERAGLEDFHWHDLRHSCASFLAMSGASLREIGEVLGHRCTQTTRRYSHLAETHTHAKVRAVADRLLGGKDE